MTAVGGLRAARAAAAGTASPDDVSEPSPFRETRFLVFALGNVANNVGEALYATAVPLLAYQRTGSLGVMTLLAAAVPVSMLLAPVFGSLADRRGTRGLVVNGLLVQAAAALVMNLLLVVGDPSPVALFGCAVLVAGGGVAYRTGWMSGIPETFPDNAIRVRGTLNSLFWATLLVGPLLVSLLLPWIGYVGLLWLNLPTFLAPLVVWAVGVGPGRRRQPTVAAQAPEPPRNRWREGATALVADRRMVAIIVVQMVIEVACGAGLISLVVFDLRDSWQLSAESAGIAIAAMNLGMLAGNLLVSQRRRMRPWLFLTVGMALRGLSLVLLVVPIWPVFVAALVLGAVGQGAAIGTAVMMRIRYLPAQLLGTASGLLWLLTGAAALLSPVVTLLLDRFLGAHLTFLVLGVGASTVLIYLARARTAWTSLRPAPTEPAEKGAPSCTTHTTR